MLVSSVLVVRKCIDKKPHIMWSFCNIYNYRFGVGIAGIGTAPP